MKTIVITGVSTGLGYGASREFIARGYKVFGSVRREEEGKRIQDELGESFIPMVFDVTDQTAIEVAARKVESMLDKPLDGLVNNAGIAVSGPISLVDLDKLRYQFEVNLIGQVGVTQAFLPLLKVDSNAGSKPGKILMISSVSGKLSFPFIGPYCASKHALEGMSDALRRELKLYGIDVVIVEPGSVQSAIWGKVDEKTWEKVVSSDYKDAATNFRNFFVKEGAKGMQLDVYSKKLVDIFEIRKPKARYVVMNKKFQKFFLPRLLPTSIVDNAVAKQLGLIFK